MYREKRMYGWSPPLTSRRCCAWYLRMYLSCRVFFSFASQYVSFLCVVLTPGKLFSCLLLWLHLRRLDRVQVDRVVRVAATGICKASQVSLRTNHHQRVQTVM